MITLKGSPNQIGREYGRTCAEKIRENLSVLVWREGYEPLPREDIDFIAWQKRQESILSDNWPWLLEEMAGVSQALEVSFEDVLLLNLRAWQYNYYGEPGGQACSSLAITLNDGTVACAGALDDAPEYYDGLVYFRPEDGYGCITCPIIGTSWALRSINEEGLSIGISSQILPGLKKLDNTIMGDLAIRIIMQTCARVDEVRDFCREHPFTMNIVCVDAKGSIFCAHNTSAGLFEIPTKDSAAMTNHIVDEEIKKQLSTMGVNEFPERDITTYARRQNLINFAQQHSGKCTAEDIMKFIATCDENNPGSINRHNKGSLFLTFANPQNDPKSFWVMQPCIEKEFKRLQIQ